MSTVTLDPNADLHLDPIPAPNPIQNSTIPVATTNTTVNIDPRPLQPINPPVTETVQQTVNDNMFSGISGMSSVAQTLREETTPVATTTTIETSTPNPYAPTIETTTIAVDNPPVVNPMVQPQFPVQTIVPPPASSGNLVFTIVLILFLVMLAVASFLIYKYVTL